MGFKDFLFNFIPHRWLDLKKEGTRRLFEGLGKALDYVMGMVDMVKAETRVKTAINSLSEREIEHGLPVDATLDIETRRKRILAKKREQGGPVNTKDFESALAMFVNGKAKIIPDHSNYFVLYKLDSPFESYSLPVVEEYVKDNKLAHLAHAYSLSGQDRLVEYVTPVKPIAHISTYQACDTFSAGGEYEL
ncbi:putative phage tail protein [Brevibacillus sp. HD3.3A]|uniref:putative phage tail protein n=1 Tax=Brevibacillus sp. HD3.3A TaxID=2738979 RepID=UPI001E4EFDBF|nr:putative phage tail protein [Brevibacillus sp. HD3.3A]UED70703.1 YmfQ family protein [Brevibacillus sp. HD3.3A]